VTKKPMPMTGGASGGVGGKPKSAPKSSPTPYQTATAKAHQPSSERKKTEGRGKKDRNNEGLLGTGDLGQSGQGRTGTAGRPTPHKMGPRAPSAQPPREGTYPGRPGGTARCCALSEAGAGPQSLRNSASAAAKGSGWSA
jgi:hypothetical protein